MSERTSKTIKKLAKRLDEFQCEGRSIRDVKRAWRQWPKKVRARMRRKAKGL